MDKFRLSIELTQEEALKLKPYRDTVGKLTIGVGRNLDDVGISREEAMYLLSNDIDAAYAQCQKHIPSFNKLNDVRQNVLVDMVFNMGWNSLSAFHNTLEAIERGDFGRAADEMASSKWDKQVGHRADVLEQMMRTGNW
jgi:lysozyme